VTKKSSRVLTLAELEVFDPQAPAAKIERRFWCPLCGEDKPRDAAHRCFCLNTQNGLWNCKRCGEKGLLGEFRRSSSEGDPSSRHQRAANALRRSFSLKTDSGSPLIEKAQPTVIKQDISANPEISAPKNPASEAWRLIYEAAQPVSGTAGEQYLTQRAIPFDVARRAGVLFTKNWHGRAALVFPFRDRNGAVVAIAGRCLRNGGIDKPASGPKKQGAFFAPAGKFAPLDEAVPAILLCEAPMDALALAAAGFPALALGGTSPPVWLAQACAFRRVALAFDSDSAGDAAAERIRDVLLSFGASPQRLRPDCAKDWNEYLQLHGSGPLKDYLALELLVKTI
jgi:hypothetical protein